MNLTLLVMDDISLIRMSSLTIAEETHKQHKHVLEAIRAMEPAWKKVAGSNFRLSEYKDSTGRRLPCYYLTKTECLYVATKFNDEARAKLVLRWEKLEKAKQAGGFPIPQSYSEALKLAANQAEQIEQQQKQIELQAPKVLFANAVETSQKSCLIGELAKILRQNGVDIGEKRLFQWLRQNGYLCSYGERYNQPTQKSMDRELFELKKTTIQKPSGEVLVSMTPKVTGKGQIYFVNKFLSNKESA